MLQAPRSGEGTRLAAEFEPLAVVARDGLARMQDQRTGLFCQKTVVAPGGEITTLGANPLYTACCAVGLLAAADGQGGPDTVAAGRALDAVVLRRQERDPSVLGTALWACALAGRGDGDDVATRLMAATDPQRASSMQLGLALAGLAHWGGGDDVRAAAGAVTDELRRRYVPRASVFAATAGRQLHHPAHGWMTSFASQVYPLVGLCALAAATGKAPAAEIAPVCDLLVRSQGEQGQWWWFYSLRAPRVIEGYPVYSVHQDAMAAMALLPASGLGLGEYRPAVAAGVRWVTGDNELGRTLVDARAGLIYRAIQRVGGDADGIAGWSRGQRGAAYLAGLVNRRRRVPRRLEILRECRSYHLGWLVLATALARTSG